MNMCMYLSLHSCNFLGLSLSLSSHPLCLILHLPHSLARCLTLLLLLLCLLGQLLPILLCLLLGYFQLMSLGLCSTNLVLKQFGTFSLAS